MDPAKVDGLAHVFADVAATRQVVVFTHDDRLTEAVRRLQLPATVFEVHRSERSVVSLRRCEHPVRRYLDDARAVCRTPEVPTQMKGEVVASYCRSAIEAACHTRIRAKRLGQGDRHVEVEQLLRSADTTRKMLSLALFDDPNRPGEVNAKLQSISPASAAAFRLSTQGAHQGLRHSAHPDDLIRDTQKLTDWLSR
jgi:hypothetical protein